MNTNEKKLHEQELLKAKKYIASLDEAMVEMLIQSAYKRVCRFVNGCENPDVLKQPPLGLCPRWLADEHRLKEINEAIKRYADEYKDIPWDWIKEQQELQERINKRNMK